MKMKIATDPSSKSLSVRDLQWLGAELGISGIPAPGLEPLAYALLIAVVMFLPNGILGGLAKLTSRWSKAS